MGGPPGRGPDPTAPAAAAPGGHRVVFLQTGAGEVALEHVDGVALGEAGPGHDSTRYSLITEKDLNWYANRSP